MRDVEVGHVAEKHAYHNRLRRAEGQIRGLQRMVEQDAHCLDVLTQISAITAALERVALSLLEDHLRDCINEAIEGGGEVADTKMTETSCTIADLVRS